TAQNLADVINATAIGFTAADDGSGALELSTDKKGTGASITIENTSTADLLTEIGMVVGTDSGTGDCADIEAVTATELVIVINTDTTGLVASDVDGFVLLTADSVGTSSRIQVSGGAANDALDFPTA